MLRLFSNRNNNSSSSNNGVNSIGQNNKGQSIGSTRGRVGKGIGGVAAARKLDEAQSRPSGSPLKNTESTFKMIARRLSFGSNRRKSVNSRGAGNLIKDAMVPSATMGVPTGDYQSTSNATSIPVVPKEVPIERRMVTQTVVDEEKAKLVNDLGEESAGIVLRVAQQFTPTDDGSDVIDISSMSTTTMKFCGRNAPPISLAIYLSRLIRNINNALSEDGNHVDSVGVRCLLIAVIYIGRMKAKQPDFQINMLNVHRLFFVAMTDALKVNEDEHPDNKYMAIVGGVDTSQLNTLEAAFCTGNDFNFIVTVDELQQMYHIYHSKKHVVVVPENHRTYPVRRVSWESRA